MEGREQIWEQHIVGIVLAEELGTGNTGKWKGKDDSQVSDSDQMKRWWNQTLLIPDIDKIEQKKTWEGKWRADSILDMFEVPVNNLSRYI